MTSLAIRGVTKSYGVTHVLDGVDLEVPAQSITAILGPSGCGKTTLLRIIAGFAEPDTGTVAFGDRVVHGAGRSVPPQHRHVGYVPQEGALFPHLDVAANVAFGLPRSQRRSSTRVDELLDLVGLGPAMRARYPHELSGGQQQRVALARALAPRPAVVLLDEPFSSLDAGLREGTGRAVIHALRAARTTALLVTHDQSEALSLSDQVAVMRAGRLAQTDHPLALYRAPVDIGVATFVGGAILLPAVVSGTVARCALGDLTVSTADGGAGSDGPAQVLVRPEQLQLSTDGAAGVSARVAEVSFYGHDAAVHLDLLPDGPRVVARVIGEEPPASGELVTVRARGRATVYAVAAPEAAPAERAPSTR
jgi:iron(III) transport system ATP-binding protein